MSVYVDTRQILINDPPIQNVQRDIDTYPSFSYADIASVELRFFARNLKIKLTCSNYFTSSSQAQFFPRMLQFEKHEQ